MPACELCPAASLVAASFDCALQLSCWERAAAACASAACRGWMNRRDAGGCLLRPAGLNGRHSHACAARTHCAPGLQAFVPTLPHPPPPACSHLTSTAALSVAAWPSEAFSFAVASSSWRSAAARLALAAAAAACVQRKAGAQDDRGRRSRSVCRLGLAAAWLPLAAAAAAWARWMETPLPWTGGTQHNPQQTRAAKQSSRTAGSTLCRACQPWHPAHQRLTSAALPSGQACSLASTSARALRLTAREASACGSMGAERGAA